MVGDWQEYNVEVSALDMRGSMATKFAKTKKDPVYQLECWGAIQSFTQSMARSSQLTVKIKKPGMCAHRPASLLLLCACLCRAILITNSCDMHQ
jgi:hypothetical protein